MHKSIKKMVGIRVAVALFAVILFSVMMTINILRVECLLQIDTQHIKSLRC